MWIMIQIPKRSGTASGGASKSGAAKKTDGSSASAKAQAEAPEDVEVDTGTCPILMSCRPDQPHLRGTHCNCSLAVSLKVKFL